MTGPGAVRTPTGRRHILVIAVTVTWAWATTASAAPFANATALKAAVDNCIAASPTGSCDCSSASVDCGAAGSDAISQWDTSRVTNMSFLFSEAGSFNEPIGNWNTSQVVDMRHMFERAGAFNQTIGNWNTSRVTNMGFMLAGASSFNQAHWCLGHKSSDGSELYVLGCLFLQPAHR